MTSTAIDRLINVASRAIKVPCRVASTANLTLLGLQTVDGVLLSSGDRVLVKDQTDGTNNGIWTAASGAWVRPADFDAADDISEGTLIQVAEGTVSGGRLFRLNTSSPNPGATSLSFVDAVTAGAVATIAALRARAGSAGAAVSLLGAVSAGDGGGGLFYWSTSSTATDDGAAVVNPTGNGPAGRWLRALVANEISLAAFSPPTDGTTDSGAAWRAAMTFLAATGGTLRVPALTLFVTIASDSDTILVPSNVSIIGTPGAVVKWNYWGSPFMAVVEKTNVKISGLIFEWGGTFGTTSGSRSFGTWTGSIPAHRYCCDIACLGSSRVVIEDVEHRGTTTANTQNIGILVEGADDGTTNAEEIYVSRFKANDLCQGMMTSGVKRFRFQVSSNRYSNASNALYGFGHVIYDVIERPSSDGEFIIEDEGTPIDAYTGGAHSFSMKNATRCVARVNSKRPEGAINLAQVTDSDIYVNHFTDVSTIDGGNGAIFFTGQGTACRNITFHQPHVRYSVTRDAPCFAMTSTMVNTDAISIHINGGAFERNDDGTQASPYVFWTGQYGEADFAAVNNGTGSARVALTIRGSSNDDNFRVRALGAVAAARVQVTSGSNNTIRTSGGGAITYDPNEFTPSSGNVVIQDGMAQYTSRHASGTTTDPGFTVQLPRPGAYLLDLHVTSTDYNHARTGLYWVVYDDATNDFTTCQLIGTQVSKGGNAPTVLTATVSAAGLVTITTTAAVSTAYFLHYGYRELWSR